MDCSLADEHVLMRSASLLCVECLWVWIPDPEPVWIWFEFCLTGLSPASPGKVNEPGRLAGEPGMELQNPDPDFWPGLGGGGGRTSLLKLGVARGEAIRGTAPGRGLEVGVEGKGPTVARGIGATMLAGVGVCEWSSGVWLGRLPCGLPPGGSMGGGTGRRVEPDILLGPSRSAPGWWRRGWGRREGWGILDGLREPPWGPEGMELAWEPPTSGGALDPLVPPPGAPMLGTHKPPLAPTWFL